MSVLPIYSALSRLVKEPSSEHVASKKRANGQCRGSPRGLTHAAHPILPIERHMHAPPHAMSVLPVLSACRGALKPSSEHVASKKRASGQHRGSPMPPAQRCPLKGTQMPLPMQRVSSPRARPHLGSPRSHRASMLPWKNMPMGNVAPHPGGHPCLSSDVAHRNAHRCPSRICNECPPHALSLVPPVSA
ncbi:hypothetical protein AAG906_005577 [Vitis piasezkii]